MHERHVDPLHLRRLTLTKDLKIVVLRAFSTELDSYGLPDLVSEQARRRTSINQGILGPSFAAGQLDCKGNRWSQDLLTDVVLDSWVTSIGEAVSEQGSADADHDLVRGRLDVSGHETASCQATAAHFANKFLVAGRF